MLQRLDLPGSLNRLLAGHKLTSSGLKLRVEP
jgi:hypothetical protein